VPGVPGYKTCALSQPPLQTQTHRTSASLTNKPTGPTPPANPQPYSSYILSLTQSESYKFNRYQHNSPTLDQFNSIPSAPSPYLSNCHSPYANQSYISSSNEQTWNLTCIPLHIHKRIQPPPTTSALHIIHLQSLITSGPFPRTNQTPSQQSVNMGLSSSCGSTNSEHPSPSAQQ
jgi:hypothetical protein